MPSFCPLLFVLFLFGFWLWRYDIVCDVVVVDLRKS